MRQIVLGYPVAKIGRKQKRLLAITLNEIAHPTIPTKLTAKSDRLLDVGTAAGERFDQDITEAFMSEREDEQRRPGHVGKGVSTQPGSDVAASNATLET